MNQYSPIDRALIAADRLLRAAARQRPATSAGVAPTRPASPAAGPAATARPSRTPRPVPGEPDAAPLSERDRERAVRLMRVNHAGEVAAQALYQGQAATARSPATRAALIAAGEEERDHLEWCEARLAELGGAPSRLKPLWYAGSLAIGTAAGLLGDRWSLGFVAETERQVEVHLSDHLARLPAADTRSRAILEQMQADEVRHGREAKEAGGAELPLPLRAMMTRVARVMTRTAYWL